MGNKLSSQYKEDKRALALALQNHDASQVKAIVQKDIALLLSRLDKGTGNTALHVAVANSDPATLASLCSLARG